MARHAKLGAVDSPRPLAPAHPDSARPFDPAVRVVPSDPAWPRAFASEAARLRAALGTVAVRIEHVGSTAVPGLAAKPIIDIQVSVRSIEPLERYRRPLAALGYLFVPDLESPDYHFFGKPAQRPRTRHLHVCEAGTPQELRHLAVRDFLRAHPAEAEAYAAVKRAAAMRHPGDRLAYMAAKRSFIEGLERRAVAWAAGPWQAPSDDPS